MIALCSPITPNTVSAKGSPNVTTEEPTDIPGGRLVEELEKTGSHQWLLLFVEHDSPCTSTCPELYPFKAAAAGITRRWYDRAGLPSDSNPNLIQVLQSATWPSESFVIRSLCRATPVEMQHTSLSSSIKSITIFHSRRVFTD